MNMDFFNIEERAKNIQTEENETELNELVQKFEDGHFSELLSETKPLYEKYQNDPQVIHFLSLIDIASHIQISESDKAKPIIEKIYEEDDNAIEDLIVYGHFAYLTDYKLARKILSDAVKQMDEQDQYDESKRTSALFLLAESEEKLQKYGRAIKYYQQTLEYFERDQGIEVNRSIILYLLVKLGNLYSIKNETSHAIDYFDRAIDLATKENELQLKIDSLISVGKIHGKRKEYNQAANYLRLAISLLEDSSIDNEWMYIESYTEMAYNHFDHGDFDDAIPYYEKAIRHLKKLYQYPKRDFGMILMQYAFSLENQKKPNIKKAGKNYERAIEELEEAEEFELLETALGDVIKFFDETNQQKKKKAYEEKFVLITNEKSNRVH